MLTLSENNVLSIQPTGDDGRDKELPVVDTKNAVMMKHFKTRTSDGPMKQDIRYLNIQSQVTWDPLVPGPAFAMLR